MGSNPYAATPYMGSNPYTATLLPIHLLASDELHLTPPHHPSHLELVGYPWLELVYFSYGIP